MYKIGCIGDSNTNNTAARSTHPWPHMLEIKLGTGYSVGDIAESGYTVSQGQTLLYTPRVITPAADYDMLILMIGINDIRIGTSAATVLSTWTTIADDAVSRGFEFMGMSCNPFKNYTGAWTQVKEDELVALNTSIAEWCTLNNKMFCDVNQILRDTVDSAIIKATYNTGDDLHYNTGGCQAIADDAHRLIKARGL